MMVDLAVVAIVKDEAPYLREWIAFHELVGVQEFYLYDNGSTDDTAALIADEMPGVLAHIWPGSTQQLAVYSDALARYGDRARWMAFLDADEFLFSPLWLPLPTVLHRYYGNDPAVGACWAMFGTSGLQSRPDAGVVCSFVQRAAEHNPVHRHVKSIVQPSAKAVPLTPHHFSCDGVDELGRPLEGPFAQSVSWHYLRVNHYWSKSVQEATEKASRPRADNGQLRSLDAFLDETFNEELDPYLALAYGRLLEERLNA